MVRPDIPFTSSQEHEGEAAAVQTTHLNAGATTTPAATSTAISSAAATTATSLLATTAPGDAGAFLRYSTRPQTTVAGYL